MHKFRSSIAALLTVVVVAAGCGSTESSLVSGSEDASPASTPPPDVEDSPPEGPTPQPAHLDGPLLVAATPPEGDLEGTTAEIAGILVLEGDCLLVDSGYYQHPRYPVVWPGGTVWQSDPPAVVLPDGVVVALGEYISGGGGYYDSGSIRGAHNALLAEAAEPCVESPWGEIAALNNGSSVENLGVPDEGWREPPSAGAALPDAMAVALHQLVTVDHTFGSGSSPFTEYLVEVRTIDNGWVGEVASPTPASREIRPDERQTIEMVFANIGPMRWISDPDEWRTDQLAPVIEGSVIVGVGEPRLDGDTAIVPIALWCGGLCGTWFSYTMDFIDGTWIVTGFDGPVAIS